MGASVIISRLYDLRITRFIVWVRKRAYIKHQKLLSDKYIDLSKKDLIPNFVKTFIEIDFIKGDEFDSLETVTKFNLLREQQKLLGMFTWKYHQWHILLILFAALLWYLSTVIN